MAADNDNYSILALPSDDLVLTGDVTLSMTNEDAAAPATKAGDGNPRTLARATGLTTVISASVVGGGNRTVVGFAVINTNGTTMSVESGAGFISNVTVPARDTEGHLIHPWIDVSGMANRTSNLFKINLSKSGSTPLQFGEVQIITAWRRANFLKGLKFKFLRPGNERLTTRLGAEHVWVSTIRQRQADGAMRLVSDLGVLLNINGQSIGRDRPFIFVPYRLGPPTGQEMLGGAWFVKLTTDEFEMAAQDHEATDVKLIFREMANTAPPPTT